MKRPPRLAGWLVRDALIVGVLALGLLGLHTWHLGADGWLSGSLVAVGGFVTAYVTCYILHEWGHWAGARLAGAEVGIGPYNQPLLARFDPAAHSRAQFLALSWGGVAGYSFVAMLCIAVWVGLREHLAPAALAVGGLAFLVQSLAVDLPQIIKVTRGADALQTNRQGASPQVIMRRTWQSWSVLAAVLVVWNALN